MSRAWKTLTEPFGMLMPYPGYYSPMVMVVLNVLVWLLMVMSGADFWEPSSIVIYDWGGNLRSAVMDGEVWRLVTAGFIHIGVLHLLGNMAFLFIFANELGKWIGNKAFVILYFSALVVASLASIVWYEDTVSAGASGAIYGLMGGLAALALTRRIPRRDRSGLVAGIVSYVGYGLFIGIGSGIDHAAHLGGFFGGLGVGILLALRLPEAVEPEPDPPTHEF